MNIILLGGGSSRLLEDSARNLRIRMRIAFIKQIFKLFQYEVLVWD